MSLARRTFLAGSLALPVTLAAGCSDHGSGELTVYSTLVRSITEQIAAALARTGLKVRFWRANSPEVAKRVMLEAKRGTTGCDLIEVEAGFLTRIARDYDCLRPLPEDIRRIGNSPYAAVSRIRANCMAWNTKAIAPDLAPRSATDLLRPEFRHKIVIVATAVPWFYALYQQWGTAKADDYFAALARQGVRASDGHSLTAELLASGEFAVSPAMYEYKIAAMKQAGDPVDFALAEPLALEQSGWAINRRSTNVAEAERFIRFMQGDGQAILRGASMVAGSIADFETAYPLAPKHPVLADAVNSSGNYAEWTDRMRKFFKASETFL